MDPATAVRRLVPPERLASRVTALDDAFVIGHFGLAVEEPDRPVVVDGLVARAVHLTPADVRALPAHRVESVHECFGNPLEPGVPVRRVANLVWTGARLGDVLALAAPLEEADSVWARGADHGEFGGIAADDYLKDLPLGEVLDRALVAYAVNDAPLPTGRGGPLRLVVPGYFGTNSVKWLTRLTLADRRPEHLFTTRLYLRPGPDGEPVPVRALDVNCAITSPAEGAVVASADGVVASADGVVVTGWAWSVEEVTAVRVTVDGTSTAVDLDPRTTDAPAWQGFRARVPLGPGEHVIAASATDAAGRVQPDAAARNAAHVVTVRVPGTGY
jgi:DMSO/TMAO reductase YedYZ molybdopterin-dependent catalytic subunit